MASPAPRGGPTGRRDTVIRERKAQGSDGPVSHYRLPTLCPSAVVPLLRRRPSGPPRGARVAPSPPARYSRPRGAPRTPDCRRCRASRPARRRGGARRKAREAAAAESVVDDRLRWQAALWRHRIRQLRRSSGLRPSGASAASALLGRAAPAPRRPAGDEDLSCRLRARGSAARCAPAHRRWARCRGCRRRYARRSRAPGPR